MKNERGFTLVELIVTVAMIAILATMITPFYLRYMRTAAVQAAAREAQTILNQARSDAIRKNCSIIAARSTGGFTFAHQNCNAPFANGVYTLPGMSAGGIFRMSEPATLAGPASVQFGRLGSVELPVAGATFTLTSTKYSTTMRVVVDPSGRITILQ